jgi:hypothetical protein
MVIRSLVLTCLLQLGALGSTAQLLQFSAVSKLPSVINTKAEEGLPLLSPDGKKLFFTRALYDGNEGGEYAGQDIWMSEYTASGWKKASNSIASINNKNNNAVAGISKDGKTLYFVNASFSHKSNGIYFVKQTGNEWSRPELIFIPGIDNLDFLGFNVSPDLDVIFLSMKASDSHGNEDLYFSVKDVSGVWSKPKNLGTTINTSGFEISPFLSADKKRLYFASNGHKGEGDADIFYSERLYDSWETWSVPVNLGNQVNSKKFDAYFSIYGDSVAYFSSNRDGQYADLFRAKVSKGRTILLKGQHYVSTEEWNAIVGKNVSTDFSFPHNSTLLSAAHEELIFYIVNKLMLERDIRFHLVVKEEEDTTLSRERLKVIRDHLKASGIDAGRIYEDQIFAVDKTKRGVVEIRLFK